MKDNVSCHLLLHIIRRQPLCKMSDRLYSPNFGGKIILDDLVFDSDIHQSVNIAPHFTHRLNMKEKGFHVIYKNKCISYVHIISVVLLSRAQLII